MQKYFAQEDAKKLVSHLQNFNVDWNNLTTPYQNGMGAVWARNINYYYNNILRGDSNTGMEFGGTQGELVNMLVPQARSLNTQYISLTTKQRLNFEPQALSTDASTLSDTRVASALCKRILQEQRLDQKAYRLAELSTLMGSAYYRVGWDLSKGKEIGFDTSENKTVYTGGLGISVHTCYDIAFDHTQEDFYELDWIRMRTLRNRWDLIAEYPHLEENIRRLPKAFQEGEMVFYWQMNINEDMVWVYEFFHRSTPALPLGRYTIFCDPNTVFFDEDNPYRSDIGAYIPVVEMKPEPIAGTGFGYPSFSNLLPLQEMLDHNFSAIATNNNAFSVKSILNPAGNDINVKLINNLKFINYKPMNVAGGGRPEVLDLNSSNSEIYNFNGTLINNMQQIAGINSAIRGEPPPGVTSGTAIATLSANAIEFAQNFSKSYVLTHELTMYYAVLAYRNFAKEPEIVAIAGPNDSTIVKTFVGSDLNDISRIQCSIANPLLATSAGKLEIANNLLQTQQVDFKKYLKILEGAPIDSLYEKEFDEENFIQEENDELRKEDGQPVEAIVEDDHPMHIQNHKALLDNIAIRRNKNLSQRIRDHILEHYEFAKRTDVMLYQMIKTGQLPDQIMQQQAAQQQQQMQQGADMGGPQASPEMQATEQAIPQEPPADLGNQDMGGMAPPPNIGAF